MLIGAAMSIACMHLYDKRVPWIIDASGCPGTVLLVGGALLQGELVAWVGYAGLGVVFVSLSGFDVGDKSADQISLRTPSAVRPLKTR